MKKTIALFLSLLICLSLCACGGSKYDKYADLFDLLESGNYDAAKDKIDQMAGNQSGDDSGSGNSSGNGSGNKPTTTVTVDMNNWSEYFEIVQLPSVSYNAFQEPTSLHASWKLRVKAAYVDKIAVMDLAVETLAKGQFVYRATYDSSTEKLTLTMFTEADYQGKAYSNPAPDKEETKTFSLQHTTSEYSTSLAEKTWDAAAGGGMYVNSVSFSGNVVAADLYIYQTVTMNRISGTIQLYS